VKALARRLSPLFPLVVGGLLLELLVKTRVVPPYILPAPSEVLQSLVVDRDEYFAGFFSTAIGAILGLSLSFLVGTTLSILLSLSTWLRRAILPYATFFQTVPVIALAPVLVIWFGFGRPTVVASAFIVSLFPIIANSLLGLQSTDPLLLDLFKLYRASRFQTLWKLQWPASLPAIFGGLRIASGLAVIGAVVGEFIAGGGLGEVVDSARTQQRLDKVFAAVLLSSILGLLLVVLIDFISRLTLRSWYAGERNFSEERSK
jgi:NitT/TauT family transport system permease protein